jgi:hypothetical protein
MFSFHFVFIVFAPGCKVPCTYANRPSPVASVKADQRNQFEPLIWNLASGPTSLVRSSAGQTTSRHSPDSSMEAFDVINLRQWNRLTEMRRFLPA